MADPASAPEPRASGPQSVAPPAAAPPPVAVQIIDHVGELVAIVCLTILAARHVLSGELALVGILSTLGVQTGLRTIGKKSTGAVGAAVMLLLPALAVAGRCLRAAGVVLLAAGILALAGCGPVRDGILATTPEVPPPSGCTVHATRCTGPLVEVCSATGRWWALPGPCPHGCVVATDGARCARAGELDGGVR